VRFGNTVDPVKQMVREKQQGRAKKMPCKLLQTDTVILGELGRLRSPASGRAWPFLPTSQIDQTISLIIPTNMSPAECADTERTMF
jgi:hypothetical protein